MTEKVYQPLDQTLTDADGISHVSARYAATLTCCAPRVRFSVSHFANARRRPTPLRRRAAESQRIWPHDTCSPLYVRSADRSCSTSCLGDHGLCRAAPTGSHSACHSSYRTVWSTMSSTRLARGVGTCMLSFGPSLRASIISQSRQPLMLSNIPRQYWLETEWASSPLSRGMSSAGSI